MMSIRSKKAQSILEYTLILGAIIAVVVLVLLRSGGIKDRAEVAYNAAADAIDSTTQDLTNHGIFR